VSATVVVPPVLREHTGGRDEVTLVGSPGTVREALAALFAAHPGLRDRLVGETGQLREHINVFVDGENIRHAAGVETAVGADTELTILPAISGG
jgi:molybdopterin converting factor small subunit